MSIGDDFLQILPDWINYGPDGERPNHNGPSCVSMVYGVISKTEADVIVRERVHNSPSLIYSVGTQVVTRKPVQRSSGRIAHPSGAVGVIVKSPLVQSHTYRVRFTDGFEAALRHDNLMLLAEYKQGGINDPHQGKVKWKHVMHLIRLLLSGITVLRKGFVPVQVGDQREALLKIKAGEMPWDEVEAWRIDLHKRFDKAFEETTLPERPDYERANEYLVKARRLAMSEELP